ncbi:MAG: tRNA (N6-isopentenyl adenosine(37)-C2)-methylthiotransferase MiaB [Candidatus Ratteibacteria bacterium]|nr:tRNA (N6-isopentenyl adenosine(37)-C2)-methylthiotransferase MiaB [Candidatus Ratteibacteria bacterium]
MKKVYIKTYGCQMNFYDSEKIKALLIKNGYKIVESPEESDIIAVNTCCVRKHAEDRALSFLSSYKHLKKQGKVFCLLGCIASLYKEDIYKKHNFIDIVCSPDNYNQLHKILQIPGKEKICHTEENKNPFISEGIISDSHISSFVSITKGCENFCSYCVVPFTRGKLISKQPEVIHREIEHLVETGVREVVLLGQNVNEYGKDIGETFTELLKKIHNIKGLVRIGFLTSHPKDIQDSLIILFKDLPKLYRHLHLPLQSGSDRILGQMNRRYTISQYVEIIDKVRKVAPDIAITSDIIVGFPSETEDDFQKTLQTIKDIKFDDLFVFKYSPRPLTSASWIEDDVPEGEKERRHRTILEAQEEISIKRNQGLIGTTDNVFVLKPADKKSGYMLGKSSTNKPVMFRSSHSTPGTFEQVTFSSADRRYLYGCSVSGHKEV